MKKQTIAIVAAIDSKRGLGKSNQLLFKIPEDFKRMRALTTGHPIIMGRKTYESIGRPLPKRTNIVITRDPSFKSEGIVAGNSLGEGIEKAKQSPGSEEIIIFGGGQIFKEALEKGLVGVLHLTIVEGDFSADTFFPDYSEFKKKIKEEKGKSGEYSYTFLDLER
jgi:dihydrofolate reductase